MSCSVSIVSAQGNWTRVFWVRQGASPEKKKAEIHREQNTGFQIKKRHLFTIDFTNYIHFGHIWFVVEAKTDSPLTKRQHECMSLAAKGMTAKEIARQLAISHRTVEQHIASAIEGLGATNRLGAVARFIALQTPSPPSQEAASFMLRRPATFDEMHLVLSSRFTKEQLVKRDAPQPLLPPLGGGKNKAPYKVRLAWIIRIATIAMMLSCAAILSVLALIEMAK